MLISLATIFVRCANEDITTSRDYPRLKTLPVSDISDSGAVFNAEIFYRGNFKILDYGFVWSENENPNLDNSDKVKYTDNIESNKFSSVISSVLKAGTSYYVRPYIRTNNYTVYGVPTKFLSLGSGAPKIYSFFPKAGTWGDTIRIYGKNFSYLLKNNAVQMGEITGDMISASDTVLSIKIPAVQNNSAVKLLVSIFGKTATSVDYFNYLEPKITSVEPLNGTYDDTITIIGENLGEKVDYNSVSFGNLSAKIVSSSASAIRVVVPQGIKATESLLNITTVGRKFQFDQTFSLNSPVFYSIEPDTITYPNEIFTIKGDNLNPILINDTVQIGSYYAPVTEANRKYIRVQIPSMFFQNKTSTYKDFPLAVKIAPHLKTYLFNLKIFW